MAVSILERPQGYIIDPDEYPAGFFDDSGNVAVGSGSHGLTTGDTIYLNTDVENYNGFFQVLVVDPNVFTLYYDQTTDLVPFIKVLNDEIFNKVSVTHGVSAVHLPITYKLSNTLYPTNSVDTSRNVNSVQDYNGFTVLQLSGSLGTVHTYDFVKLTLPSDTDLSGVYQIVEWISDTVLIVNIPYESSNDFTGATALKHYNNYNIIVRVYAGINASHEWTAQKPYELAATLKYIPDENNEVFFSINELLKSYVETKNNLLLGTLPNNIDFWNNFYIEVAESYDDSNGYTFGTLTSSFTSDQSTFEGTSVNAKLLFKNLHSGSMSEYLMTNSQAKFLTLFTIPVLFGCSSDLPDCYQDISFILPNWNIAMANTFRAEYYSNGIGPVTVDTSIDEEEGVIRFPIEADCDYDRVDISILGGVQLINNPEFNATGSWLQTATASADWTIANGTASVSMVSFVSSEYLYQASNWVAGNYHIVTEITTVDGGNPADDWQSAVHVYFFSGGIGGTLVADQLIGTLSGAAIGDVPSLNFNGTIAVGSAFDAIAIRFLGSGPYTDSFTGIINNLFVARSDQPISETKQFDIDCNCSNQELPLTWLNNLGGFEYWNFTGNKDDITEIREAIETKKNILPNWPKSYGADADTIRRQTVRISNKSYTVRSQFLTEDEVTAISYIKSSVLVQIINSRNDRRTVIVDTDSFIIRKDGDRTHEIAFNISFTDDIPAQTV